MNLTLQRAVHGLSDMAALLTQKGGKPAVEGAPQADQGKGNTHMTCISSVTTFRNGSLLFSKHYNFQKPQVYQLTKNLAGRNPKVYQLIKEFIYSNKKVYQLIKKMLPLPPKVYQLINFWLFVRQKVYQLIKFEILCKKSIRSILEVPVVYVLFSCRTPALEATAG